MQNTTIYDVRGRWIHEQANSNANTTALHNLKAEQQVLLVQITSDDNKVVTKKVVYYYIINKILKTSRAIESFFFGADSDQIRQYQKANSK